MCKNPHCQTSQAYFRCYCCSFALFGSPVVLLIAYRSWKAYEQEKSLASRLTSQASSKNSQRLEQKVKFDRSVQVDVEESRGTMDSFELPCFSDDKIAHKDDEGQVAPRNLTLGSFLDLDSRLDL